MDLDGPNLLLWRDFERDLRLLNRSPRTIQSYLEAAEQLADHHDGADLTGLVKTEVQAYLLHTMEQHSAQTAAVRFRSLRRFYNWMVAEEVIEASPMDRLSAPKPDEKPTPVPPIDDVRQLLVTCEGKRLPDGRTKGPRRLFDDVRDQAIIRLFCEAGAPRVSEMAGLELVRLDMTQDVVTVLGKGRKWRSIPFGARTGKALSRYLRARSRHPLAADPLLWIGSRGQALTPSGIYQMIERRCVEAGIGRIHPHQLRHFAVDAWYEDGGSIQDAMSLFGWSSPAMAHHYAKATAGKRAINAARRASIGDQL